jgi:hypothetical protein
MGRAFCGLLAALALACGVAIKAQDREIPRGIQAQPGAPELPTPAFQGVMKSNSVIVTVDGSGTATTGTLTKSLTVGKEDFEAVLKDASTLRENYAKIEAFFAQRNIKDAVEFAKAGAKGVDELEKAAKAKTRAGAARAQLTIAMSCRRCHLAHRAHVLTYPLQYGIIVGGV